LWARGRATPGDLTDGERFRGTVKFGGGLADGLKCVGQLTQALANSQQFAVGVYALGWAAALQ
jgi:hypothetical protein